MASTSAAAAGGAPACKNSYCERRVGHNRSTGAWYDLCNRCWKHPAHAPHAQVTAIDAPPILSIAEVLPPPQEQPEQQQQRVRDSVGPGCNLPKDTCEWMMIHMHMSTRVMLMAAARQARLPVAMFTPITTNPLPFRPPVLPIKEDGYEWTLVCMPLKAHALLSKVSRDTQKAFGTFVPNGVLTWDESIPELKAPLPAPTTPPPTPTPSPATTTPTPSPATTTPLPATTTPSPATTTPSPAPAAASPVKKADSPKQAYAAAVVSSKNPPSTSPPPPRTIRTPITTSGTKNKCQFATCTRPAVVHPDTGTIGRFCEACLRVKRSDCTRCNRRDARLNAYPNEKSRAWLYFRTCSACFRKEREEDEKQRRHVPAEEDEEEGAVEPPCPNHDTCGGYRKWMRDYQRRFAVCSKCFHRTRT